MNIFRHVDVFICHDSPLVSAGLAATLREQPDLRVAVGASPPEAAAACDVLVADYATGLQFLDAMPAARRAADAPPPRLLVVTSKLGEWDIRHAMARGVHGYLLLGCPAERLVDAVRSLARGGRCFDDAVSARMADSLIHAALTRRENDVLQLMSHGAGNKDIARRLDIQLGTVKAHVKAILEKLQVRTRTQAVVVAEHRGLLRASQADDASVHRMRELSPARAGLPAPALLGTS